MWDGQHELESGFHRTNLAGSGAMTPSIDRIMKRQRTWNISGVFWILVYILIVVAPVFAMLIGPRPIGRPLWRDFSVAIAFCAMSIIGLQFVLTARIPSVKRPFGSDAVYFFHHQISVVAVGLVLLHVLVLGLDDAATWRLLAFWSAPLRARFALTSVLLLAALVLVSIFRKRLGMEYTTWRITHGLLAIGAVALGMTHMQLVGIYLSSPWKRALWGLYAALWISSLAYARVIRPLAMKLHPYVVDRVQAERGNAWTLTLRPLGHAGTTFAPGQFAWITVARSPFADLEHPFSFSSSAEQKGGLSFTIKELGDFTEQIPALSPGTRVYVDGPFGAFSIDRRPDARAYVFIAGGIGITPIMSMLRTMRDRNDSRSCLLIYAARSLREMTFREELVALEGELNLHTQLVPSIPHDTWAGPSGRLTPELMDQLLSPTYREEQCEAYLCGPLPMMDAVESSLIALGIPRRRIHSERFNLA
jgi:predicted ferric reductase